MFQSPSTNLEAVFAVDGSVDEDDEIVGEDADDDVDEEEEDEGE